MAVLKFHLEEFRGPGLRRKKRKTMNENLQIKWQLKPAPDGGSDHVYCRQSTHHHSRIKHHGVIVALIIRVTQVK